MTRKEWLTTMDKIVRPVFRHLSEGNLHRELPEILHPERKRFRLLEAYGRTLAGIAPWLALESIDDPGECALQSEYRDMVVKGLAHAVNPASKDYMNFTEQGQPLVDAAFLAHGIVRAPNLFVDHIPDNVKEQLITALKETRQTIPPNINWNLFSAMVEGALYVLEADFDLLRVLFAIRLLDDWYLGDGIYGDGPEFHSDYYNSFVIQPMAVDLLDLFYDHHEEIRSYHEKMIPRFVRYAIIQERLIGPDGSFPVIGRSIVYRTGVFQALAQAALQNRLPKQINHAQVRCGLSAVIDKVLRAPDTFDDKGWLLPGIVGHQENLAEEYINTGSLYLCSTVFLPLGLSAEHLFWSDQDRDWSGKLVWRGETIPIDQSI